MAKPSPDRTIRAKKKKKKTLENRLVAPCAITNSKTRRLRSALLDGFAVCGGDCVSLFV